MCTASDVVQMITILQCLQRLAGSCQIISAILQVPDIASRIQAILLCGNDHVATEAARLLVRMWSPATSRVGSGMSLIHQIYSWKLSCNHTNLLNVSQTIRDT